MSSSRVYTDIDVTSFEIYNVKQKYLEYGTSNSFISTVDLGIEANQFFYTNNEISKIELPSTLTRTFEIDGSTCDFTRAQLDLYDRDGNILDENSSPFWFDGEAVYF